MSPEKNESFFYWVSRVVPKKNENWPAIAEIIKLVFPLKMGKDESKLSILRTS